MGEKKKKKKERGKLPTDPLFPFILARGSPIATGGREEGGEKGRGWRKRGEKRRMKKGSPRFGCDDSGVSANRQGGGRTRKRREY